MFPKYNNQKEDNVVPLNLVESGILICNLLCIGNWQHLLLSLMTSAEIGLLSPGQEQKTCPACWGGGVHVWAEGCAACQAWSHLLEHL